MAVYLDRLADWGWHRGRSCHLIADSVAELMEFAVIIGLRPEWYQPVSSPHFDLDEASRRTAIQYGAVDLDRRAFVKKLRELRTSRETDALRVTV